MKCKNWSNKLNNFVVRKLKSFKINGQQQVLSSTMPAMPKEKQTTPISLDENNFDEIKMKEQLNISSTSIASMSSSVSRLFRRCNSNDIEQQQQQQQLNRECSCQRDDCCQILTTSSSTSAIDYQTTTTTARSGSFSNKKHYCSSRLPLTESLQENNSCSCSKLNNSSNINSNTCNDLRQGYMSYYCNKNNSTRKTSPVPKMLALSCSDDLGLYSPSTSSASILATSSTSSPSSITTTTAATTTSSVNSSNCSCSRVNFNNENRRQYQHLNGDISSSTSTSSTASTTTATSLNKIPNKLENNCSIRNENKCCSGGSSSSCSSNTTAQSSQVATTISSNAPQQQQQPETSSASGFKIRPLNGVHSIQQPQPQLPKKTPNDFIFEQYIGEGSFSTVYYAKEVRSKKEVAIKVCEKAHVIREKKQEYVKREREVMHRMSSCPGFVNLYCTFQDESRLYFVMTYAKNGDLLPYINKVGSFDLECTQHYAAELVLACENMHKRGIVHRDLKPENILLDENMHTLIADFGSAKIIDNNRDYITSSSSSSATSTTGGVECSTTSELSSPLNRYRGNRSYLNDVENDEAQARTRRRKCSFVGTAQYVSPELLQNGTITPACDLWALGCIIYQMISGLPPFRGNSEYLIFKQILNLNLEFPEGFDKNAEDLVRNLLKLNPQERLGAQDKIGCYESIRTHPFFDGINWDTVRLQTPPTIYPYLPGANKEDELRSQYRVPENLEPGLNDKQLTRLLGLGLMGIDMETDKTEPKNKFNLTETEMKNRLEAQKADKWNAFAEGELILKKGFVNKRKGLFSRKRMLLLLTGPKLVYIDPVAMVKKGEIPWSAELRVEPKNFKIFFVHTPNRTYYLEDPEGYALKWVNAIENVRRQTYADPNQITSHSH